MPAFRPVLAAAVLLSFMTLGHATATAPKATLKPFASEAELKALLLSWADRYQARRAEQMTGALQSAPAAAPAAKAAESAADSITNVQHAGVDEGGIVKLHGEHLVILRRGRLFTVEVGGLRPVSAVDAFGPDIDPRGAWYDEMLIWQDTVVVIGYSYARGGTEVGLFDLSPAGELRYRSTHHLRSNDYYSSRNYASRLIGSKLVFYTPLYTQPGRADPFAQFPAARRGRRNSSGLRRPRASTAPTRRSTPPRASRCTACRSATSPGAISPARAPRCSGPRDACSTFRPSRCSCGGGEFVALPHPARRRRAERPQGERHTDRPVLVPRGRHGYLNVLVRSSGRGEAMWSAEFNPAPRWRSCACRSTSFS